MSLYTALARPLLFALSPEAAHSLTLGVLRTSSVSVLARALSRRDDPRLAIEVWGQRHAHPVGLAAGLDKNGIAIDGFAALGLAHVEIGTITTRAQPGNPRPRLFRLTGDRAIVNRMGFNNRGVLDVSARLAARRTRPACVLGVNVGKSKVVDLAAALEDYVVSVRALAPVADYLVINVSSPNTPGLRDLQTESALRPLLEGVRRAVDDATPPRAGRRTPLLLKIAPDLADAAIDAVVDVALGAGCDGLIATNTTLARDALRASRGRIAAIGAGGLSGAPLRARATAVLARVARRVDGRVPIVGVGGVDSAEAAWEKIIHGATLVQLYTGLIYEGPGLIGRILDGLTRKLETLGLSHIDAAIGRAL